MSRTSPAGDQILVKPSSNVYTTLVVVAIIGEILALLYLWTMHKELIGMDLFPGG